MRKIDYVLLTSAYNEHDNIAKTMESVISQTCPPLEWIVVSDGSVDGTDAVIQDYASRFSFITYCRLEKEEAHSYCSKVRAINWALTRISVPRWEYLGILDADISFDPGYFEALAADFEHDPRLGLCGGHIVEMVDGIPQAQRISHDSSVAGAVQFFRRECWNRVGGFIPMPHGGEDAAAEIIARSGGWKVRTDMSLKVTHYGFVGKGSGTIYKAKIRRGKSYFHLGYHPLFETARCLSRLFERPCIVGSLLELWGYATARLSGEKRLLPKDAVCYLRDEQLSRLFNRKAGE